MVIRLAHKRNYNFHTTLVTLGTYLWYRLNGWVASLKNMGVDLSLPLADSGNTKGKYHCTIDLLFGWFEISCMTTDNFCFYLKNRLIQTSQTGGQRYSNTCPFSIPWLIALLARMEVRSILV